MSQVSIYLAGKSGEGRETSDDDSWSLEQLRRLTAALEPIEALLLNPADRIDDLSDELSIFGRDMLQVFASDVVFVDAHNRRGLGVGAEMMWAKMHIIPVVALAPCGSLYNPGETAISGEEEKNYIHPFVHGLSDVVVPDIETGATWIRDNVCQPGQTIKGAQSIRDAMTYYRDAQLAQDIPMLDLQGVSQILSKRISLLERSQ